MLARSHCATAVFGLVLSMAVLVAPIGAYAGSWPGYAQGPQHTALSSVPTLPLRDIVWQTPVDLQPQYVDNTLLIHYGSPLCTAANTVIVPVKVGVADTFKVEARSGATGALRWDYTPDYRLPVHNWTPSYGPVITPGGRLYLAGAGGTLLYTDNLDAAGPHTFTRVCFYGLANYNGNPAAFNADVQICTGLTSDAQGNLYFGYRATGANPLGLTNGMARVSAAGAGVFVTTSGLSGLVTSQSLMNCAPAISNDGSTIYTAIRRAPNNATGWLLALDATTLAMQHRVDLIDPKSLLGGRLPNDGTSSPTVGPDGRVYFGVLENPPLSNNARGWLLQFDAALNPVGVPGAFGWDFAPSIVPSWVVPSYTGASSYLLMCKYNNYAGVGGDGVNKLAIVDPNDSQLEPFSGIVTMKEILVIAGATPDPAQIDEFPNAVREWCINTAAVDPFKRSVLAGAEDGKLYRWDLTVNAFTEVVTLTAGLGEAYTPTLIGADGKVYAINNAILFAVGVLPGAGVPSAAARGLELAVPHPNPFETSTVLSFALPRPGRATLEILDAGGRRVATLVDRDLPAGTHAEWWGGADAAGRRSPPGVYFARLETDDGAVTRRLLRIH